MKQSGLMSLVEAIANVVVGYGIAVATQLLVFPWFGLPAHLDDALVIGLIFTAVSIARRFVWIGSGSQRRSARGQDRNALIFHFSRTPIGVTGGC